MAVAVGGGVRVGGTVAVGRGVRVGGGEGVGAAASTVERTAACTVRSTFAGEAAGTDGPQATRSITLTATTTDAPIRMIKAPAAREC